MDLGQAAIVDTNQNDLAPERGSKLTLLPLRRSLPGSVAVIGVTTPAVIMLWAITHLLWLVVHYG